MVSNKYTIGGCNAWQNITASTVRVLAANCVTCSYIDNNAPFHNRMSVIHNIFVKFLQTIYLYKAESARKIDAQLNFQYTGCLI